MQIGVYGLGRFGSFWAGCLRDNIKNDRIVAYSRSAHEVPTGVELVSEEEVLNSDILFYCVAISVFEKVLERSAHRIKKGAIVMDTCSVKTYPASWMQKYISKEECTLIATHPMFGPDSAKNGLKGLPIVLCPLQVEDEKFSFIKDMFASWNLDVLVMTPREHDREAAFSQGVTHFVGRTLHQMGMTPTPIATQGYRSLMTIVDQTCNDPLQLFYDLQRFNPYAREMRLSLQVAIEKILNELAEQEEKI